MEGISTNSLKDNFTVNPCNFVTHQKYECRISSAKLSHTYVMLLKITKGIALLQSPLMSVSPMDIGKFQYYVAKGGMGIMSAGSFLLLFKMSTITTYHADKLMFILNNTQ